MGKERLEQNLIDQMKEAQLKLGFEEETMRLYYPVASLTLLLGTNCETAKEMVAELTDLFADGTGVLGAMSFRVSAGRIEVSVPPAGARYVHEHMGCGILKGHYRPVFQSPRQECGGCEEGLRTVWSLYLRGDAGGL